jgi:hypothetical protein
MRTHTQARRRTKKAIALAAGICALGALCASLALAQTVSFGNVTVKVEGAVTPSKLPKNKPVPITLKLEGQIATTDGSNVPALKTLNLQFDRHGTIYTKGLATCAASKLQGTTTQAARKACGPALVGTGKASAEIYLPEQAAFSAQGPMLIFNGPPKGGRPVLIIHVHANVPAPTTFVTEGVIGKGHGKYGTATQIEIPTIVGGQGSLTGFEAKIGRTWTYKGKKQSLLHADCPTGALFAHGEFAFVDGDKISGDIAKAC